MSATIYYEPHRLPAGILALVVHSVFFALLYFGFNWNRQVFSPATMSVELWPSLPERIIAPPDVPKVEEVVPPPVLQEKIPEPEIAMPQKKKPITRPVKVAETRHVVTKVVEKKPIDKSPVPSLEDQKAARDQALMADQAAREQAEKSAQEANSRAEQAAAKGRVVDEYRAKIIAKIKRNIVEPPNVAQDVHAEFSVTLLPGGAVLKAELGKSSGNTAYDNAVERAILKSAPLPLPQDMELFSAFRELLLTFKPEKPTE